MAEGKKAFVLYCDIIHTVEKLTNEQAGCLFKHTLRYVNDLNPEPDSLITELTFEPMKQQLKRDLRKYEQKQAQRVEAGKRSAEARKAKEAERLSTVVDFRSTNPTVIGKGIVTGIVIGKDKDKENIERENIPTTIKISELFEFLNQNQIWKEQVCMANYCKMEETEEAIAEFVARQKAENVEWKYTQDAYSHFSNWFRIQLERKKKEKNERAKKNQLSAADKDEELLRHVAQGIERANAQRAAREQRG